MVALQLLYCVISGAKVKTTVVNKGRTENSSHHETIAPFLSDSPKENICTTNSQQR